MTGRETERPREFRLLIRAGAVRCLQLFTCSGTCAFEPSLLIRYQAEHSAKGESKNVSHRNNRSASSLDLQKIKSTGHILLLRVSLPLLWRKGIAFQSVFYCGVCNQHWISYNSKFLISKEDILKFNSYDLSSFETHTLQKGKVTLSQFWKYLRQRVTYQWPWHSIYTFSVDFYKKESHTKPLTTNTRCSCHIGICSRSFWKTSHLIL